jgi:hypothetical protein
MQIALWSPNGRVPEVLSRCKQVYCGSSVWKQVGISIYLKESLKGPKWLIPEVAQPQWAVIYCTLYKRCTGTMIRIRLMDYYELTKH